jgi:hypothetical protein
MLRRRNALAARGGCGGGRQHILAPVQQLGVRCRQYQRCGGRRNSETAMKKISVAWRRRGEIIENQAGISMKRISKIMANGGEWPAESGGVGSRRLA